MQLLSTRKVPSASQAATLPSPGIEARTPNAGTAKLGFFFGGGPDTPGGQLKLPAWLPEFRTVFGEELGSRTRLPLAAPPETPATAPGGVNCIRDPVVL
jgi:hypothetical protein